MFQKAEKFTGAGRLAAGLLAATLMVCGGAVTHAQDEGGEEGAAKTWSDSAELSIVATDGNSESATVGFKNEFKKWWDDDVLEIVAAGIRAETTTFSRTAMVDPNNPANVIVTENKDTNTTAETYLFRGRYDHALTPRFFWYGSLAWDRNRPAGVQNRYVVIGGVGNNWYDTDDLKFKTDYAVTYTDQEDVVDNPTIDDTFIGFRFSWDYFNRLSATTIYENKLIVDENLDETDDWRATMSNAVTVTMTDVLALKTTLAFFYDNEPSFELLPVTGGLPGQTFPYQLDELDTFLSVSLVVNF